MKNYVTSLSMAVALWFFYNHRVLTSSSSPYEDCIRAYYEFTTDNELTHVRRDRTLRYLNEFIKSKGEKVSRAIRLGLVPSINMLEWYFK